MALIIVSIYILIRAIADFIIGMHVSEYKASDIFWGVVECIVLVVVVIMSIFEYINKRHLENEVDYLTTRRK